MNILLMHLLENPAFWIFVICSSICIMWGIVNFASWCIFRGMEPSYDMGCADNQHYKFGFRRVSPDGTRYQWWVDNHWLEADEFLERCSGLGMSEQSVIDEFGYSATPPRPILP